MTHRSFVDFLGKEPSVTRAQVRFFTLLWYQDDCDNGAIAPAEFGLVLAP